MRFFHDIRTTWLLAAILGLGFLVRFMHLWFLSDTAFLRFHEHCNQTDMFAFWQWAQAIVAGDWLGRETYHPDFVWMKEIAPIETWHRWWGGKEIYHQAPLYPHFLAVILALKNSPVFAVAIQLLIGALQPLVMFSLARRLFDNKKRRIGISCANRVVRPFCFLSVCVFARLATADSRTPDLAHAAAGKGTRVDRGVGDHGVRYGPGSTHQGDHACR